jgi:hypothetical protein
MINPIKKLNCLIDTIWLTLKSFIKTGDLKLIMGHIYDKFEIHRNCYVIIQYCGDCKHISTIWQKEGLNTDKEMMNIYGTLEGNVDFSKRKEIKWKNFI